MARKERGFVELEWTCPVCKSRNPGPQRTCAGCGSPQPADVQFEVPVESERITDPESVAQIQQGPDIHCGYCGARNPAGATVCRQCGADLSAGQAREAGATLGALPQQPAGEVSCAACGAKNAAGAATCIGCGAPLARPVAPAAKPQRPPSARKSRSWLWILGGLALAGIVLLIFFAGRSDSSVGTVTGGQWKRIVTVEGLVPVQNSAWWDEVPQGATLGACRPEVRRVQDEPAPGAREVCGTEYVVDQGEGHGQVVQDCQYEILEDRCTYTVVQWREVDSVSLGGQGLSMAWPQVQLGQDQRLGQRLEQFECQVVIDDEVYTVRPRSLEEYESCTEGSRWNLEINTFGQVLSAQPAR